MNKSKQFPRVNEMNETQTNEMLNEIWTLADEIFDHTQTYPKRVYDIINMFPNQHNTICPNQYEPLDPKYIDKFLGAVYEMCNLILDMDANDIDFEFVDDEPRTELGQSIHAADKIIEMIYG